MSALLRFVYDDGGRAAAGFKGETGDCVTRSIAIATGSDYRWVYDELTARSKVTRVKGRTKASAARTGVPIPVIRKFMTEEMGWTWFPTMGIGTGCQVHLRDGEIPMGRLVVSVSKHEKW